MSETRRRTAVLPSGATVLVVEDDPSTAVLFRTILEQRGGLGVILCSEPGRAVRLVERQEVDLVLMDVSLTSVGPDGEAVDGLELTRRLRALGRAGEIPVILCTAHAMRGDRERFLFSSGANDYLAKPVADQDALVELVRRHLGVAGDRIGKASSRE